MHYTTSITHHVRATALRTVAFVAPFAAAVACSGDTTAPSATAGRAARALDPRDASPTEAGPKIAFEADDRGYSHIFTVNPDGTGLKRVTKGHVGNSQPAWSPDRQQIAFASTRITGTSFGLYVMSANGQNIRQIMSCLPSCTFPSWSPDGTGIAFLQGIASNPHMLRVQSLVDGVPQGPPSVLAENVTESGRPRWSPDNSEIAVVAEGDDGQTDVYAVPAGGGEPRRITNTAAKELLPSWAQ